MGNTSRQDRAGKPEATFADDNGTRSFLLTAAARKRRSEDVTITPADLGVDAAAGWRVTRTTLRGGKQEGVGLITIDNGRLRIEVIETRGLSLLSVIDGDCRIGWQSPVTDVVHPMWIDLASRDGKGWLEGFNELLVRCGLEYAGAPGRDDEARAGRQAELTLHGRIGNTPASHVEVIAEANPPFRVGVRGLVQERSFSGPMLDLVAEVSTLPGEASFRIVDEVTNQSDSPQEFMLIYHTNFGPPLLGDRSELVLPVRSVAPINQADPCCRDTYAVCGPPRQGYEEEVYVVEPLPDAHGSVTALLHNAAKSRGVSLRWRLEELPCFTFWKNLAASSEGYVVGLEPGVCYPNNRGVERLAGRLPVLGAKQSRRFALEMGILHGAEKIGELRRDAHDLQSSG